MQHKIAQILASPLTVWGNFRDVVDVELEAQPVAPDRIRVAHPDQTAQVP